MQFSLTDLGPIGTRLGDYDNDGDLDLALGYRQEGFAPHFYRNDAGAYVNSGNNINGLGLGTLVWGDFDNDGRLDLLQTGENYSSTARYTRLFRNCRRVATIDSPVRSAWLVQGVVASR